MRNAGIFLTSSKFNFTSGGEIMLKSHCLRPHFLRINKTTWKTFHLYLQPQFRFKNYKWMRWECLARVCMHLKSLLGVESRVCLHRLKHDDANYYHRHLHKNNIRLSFHRKLISLFYANLNNRKMCTSLRSLILPHTRQNCVSL